MKERKFLVQRIGEDYEDVILLYSGSESECEEYFLRNGGVYQEGAMVYDMEIWEVEEDV